MENLTTSKIETIKAARNIFETTLHATDCTLEDYELFEVREVMQTIIDWLEDNTDQSKFSNTLELDKLVTGEVRVIVQNEVKEVLQDYLTNYYDEYVLGCAYPSFLASITDLPIELLEIIHDSGDQAFSALGKYLTNDEEIMAAYAQGMDNGEAFSGYDGKEHETKCNDFYVYRTN